MLILRVTASTSAAPAGWQSADFTAAGTLIADLTDQDTSSSSGWSLENVTPFAAFTSSSTLVDQDHHGWPESVWEGLNFSREGDADPAAVFDFIGPGSEIGKTYNVHLAGAWTDDKDVSYTVEGTTEVYDNTAQTTPITPAQPVSISAVAVDDGSGNARLRVTSDYGPGSDRNFLAGVVVEETATNPSISNINTDNTGNQYEQVTATVADFADNITTFTLGGSSGTVIDGDVADNEVSLRLPGDLTTGTYTATLSNASESADIQFDYTQTHARPAFDGLVDSNSILNGQTYTENSYFRFVTNFSNGTLDTSAGDDREWQDDIADYYTPDSGFTGDDTASIEFLYNDGTTSATVDVTITVDGGSVVGWALRRRNKLNIGMGL